MKFKPNCSSGFRGEVVETFDGRKTHAGVIGILLHEPSAHMTVNLHNIGASSCSQTQCVASVNQRLDLAIKRHRPGVFVSG